MVNSSRSFLFYFNFTFLILSTGLGGSVNAFETSSEFQSRSRTRPVAHGISLNQIKPGPTYYEKTNQVFNSVQAVLPIGYMTSFFGFLANTTVPLFATLGLFYVPVIVGIAETPGMAVRYIRNQLNGDQLLEDTGETFDAFQTVLDFSGPNRLEIPLEFANLGEMVRIGGLVWSAILPEKLDHYAAKEFCEQLDAKSPGWFKGKKGLARLPTVGEWDVLRKTIGYPRSYRPDRLNGMRDNWFWSANVDGDAFGAYLFNGNTGGLSCGTRTYTGGVRCVIPVKELKSKSGPCARCQARVVSSQLASTSTST